MNDHRALERRVAALIRAYADRAPTDVDPMAIARLAATGSPLTAPVWFGLTHARRGLAFALVLIAVLVSIVSGALISGALPIRPDPVDRLLDRAFVEPFVGLPPEGAAPSSPEKGELVLSFAGRVSSLGGDFHRMWLYADGRLIWKSNLEGGSAGWKLRFGASEPTTAVIEQRLSPEGVELLRSAAIAAGLHDFEPFDLGEDPTDWGRPGVLWGGLVMRDGGRLVQSNWSDPALPGLLAVPGSWLPAGAWEDQRIGAYVPSRHAVCLEPSGLIHALSDPTRELILSNAIRIAPARNSEDLRCPYRVAIEDARAIVATLDDAGLERRPFLRYHIPFGLNQGWIEILPVVPNGDVVCDCG
jgi:hypothetical protein